MGKNHEIILKRSLSESGMWRFWSQAICEDGYREVIGAAKGRKEVIPASGSFLKD